jgi:hypothetical protein
LLRLALRESHSTVAVGQVQQSEHCDAILISSLPYRGSVAEVERK